METIFSSETSGFLWTTRNFDKNMFLSLFCMRSLYSYGSILPLPVRFCMRSLHSYGSILPVPVRFCMRSLYSYGSILPLPVRFCMRSLYSYGSILPVPVRFCMRSLYSYGSILPVPITQTQYIRSLYTNSSLQWRAYRTVSRLYCSCKVLQRHFSISRESQSSDRARSLVVCVFVFVCTCDSRRYQIFWEAVGLERGPFSLVSTTEELLDRKVAAPV
jgi:hypothetical protein